jgi:TRAP-type C4-dicarboxylate transport system permease small subunit
MKDDNHSHSLLVRSLSVLCALIFAVLVSDVLFGVFTRQVLDAQPAWTEEVARFLLVWLALLGGVLAYAGDQHLGVDVLVSRLQPQDQKIALIISHICVLSFSVAVLVIGGQELFRNRWASEQTLPSLGIRKAWFYLVLPLGGVLISFLALGKIWAVFHLKMDKEESA